METLTIGDDPLWDLAWDEHMGQSYEESLYIIDEPPRSSTDTVYLPMTDPTPTGESYSIQLVVGSR